MVSISHPVIIGCIFGAFCIVVFFCILYSFCKNKKYKNSHEVVVTYINSPVIHPPTDSQYNQNAPISRLPDQSSSYSFPFQNYPSPLTNNQPIPNYLPPAYSQTPVYSTTTSGQAPSLRNEPPPKYQSFLNQSTVSDVPSMRDALWTSSRTDINMETSTRRITSWDSAQGDSIESHRIDNYRSSNDNPYDLRLGPLDERIESESEGCEELDDTSGRWLEGLNKGNNVNAGRRSKGSDSRRSKHKINKEKSSDNNASRRDRSYEGKGRKENRRNRSEERRQNRHRITDEIEEQRNIRSKQQSSSRNDKNQFNNDKKVITMKQNGRTASNSAGSRKGIKMNERNVILSFDSGMDTANDSRNSSRIKYSTGISNAAYETHSTDI